MTRLLLPASVTDPASALGGRPLIKDLSAEYLLWSEDYYKGKGDWPNVRGTQKLLIEFARDLRGDAFKPNELRRFQRFLIGKGHARKTVNAHAGRVRRFFRWCQSRELIPAGHSANLDSVQPLMPGRTDAPECSPILPVSWAVVEKTLPHMPPNLAIAVRVQYLCGMRPAEVLKMRAGEFDKRHSVWLWRPVTHKTAHRLLKLVKAIPPSAQIALAPILKTKNPGELLFTPEDAEEWKLSQRAKRRRTKIYPYELARIREKRLKTKPRVKPKHYTTSRYLKEVVAAVAKANKGTPVDQRLPHWTPLQLRHAIATEVSGLLGEQAAQRWMGHARLETTAIYTAAHEKELREVAAKLDPHLPQQTPAT